MPRPWRNVFCAIAAATLIALAGCGGTSSNSSSNNPPPMPPPGNGAVNAPTVVTLAGGQSATGINISVPTPASNPTPNALVLGTTTGTSGSASDTGATVKTGSAETVLIFGPGLSANMQISISGPADISISGAQTIKATDGTPGVAFNINVASNAALGARTVVLQDTNNDITSFTGGLEVTQ